MSAPGWYPDPASGERRWWNGTQWADTPAERLTGWDRWTGPSSPQRTTGEQLLRVVCFAGACSFVVFVLILMVLYAATID